MSDNPNYGLWIPATVAADDALYAPEEPPDTLLDEYEPQSELDAMKEAPTCVYFSPSEDQLQNSDLSASAHWRYTRLQSFTGCSSPILNAMGHHVCPYAQTEAGHMCHEYVAEKPQTILTMPHKNLVYTLVQERINNGVVKFSIVEAGKNELGEFSHTLWSVTGASRQPEAETQYNNVLKALDLSVEAAKREDSAVIAEKDSFFMRLVS